MTAPQRVTPERRPSPLRQTRSRRTRQELVMTAIRLWQTQDFDDITVDTIVEAAGVSKGTFYYHFRRKEDLLVELGWATVDRVGEEAERAHDQGATLDQALDIGIAGLHRRVSAMPRGAVARTIQEFMFSRPAVPQPRQSGRRGFMSGVLRAAQRSGELPASAHIDEVADMLNHILIRSILDSVNGETIEPLDAVLRRRTRLLLYGATAAYPPEVTNYRGR
jgi:AcrR family transcriptional regulator